MYTSWGTPEAEGALASHRAVSLEHVQLFDCQARMLLPPRRSDPRAGSRTSQGGTLCSPSPFFPLARALFAILLSRL